jgi:lysophospholipase L1-like esterase
MADGIVTLGDSLAHADAGWPRRLADAAGMSLERRSANGARSVDVLEQLATLEGSRHYDVGCLAVGTNDVLFDWSPELFAERLATIVAGLQARCEAVVVPTLSLQLFHFPGCGSMMRRRVVVANAAIRAQPVQVIDGTDLRRPRTFDVDRIHPTVVGHARLADRAAAALGLDVRPSELLTEAERRDWRLGLYETADYAVRLAAKRVLGREPTPIG